MSTRSSHQILALSAVALAVLCIVWSPIRLDDVWWHMLTGRYLLENGSVPTSDPFSYTASGQPWVNWEWLSGLLMVTAYDRLGGWGLVGLRFAAVMGAATVLWAHLFESDTEQHAIALPARLLLVSLVVVVIFGRVSDRPHLYALPFLAAAHQLSTRAFAQRRAQPVLVLFGLMVPWVLLHPSWPLGIVVHCAVMADAWLSDPKARRIEGPVAMRWSYRFSPVLLGVPGLLLHDVSAYASAVGSLFATTGLREWQTLWTYLHWTNTPLLAFFVLCLLWLGSLAARPARLYAPSSWLVLLIMLSSWWFVRFTPVFALVATPQIYSSFASRWRTWGVPRRTAALGAVLVGMLLLLVVVRTKSLFGHPYSAAIDARDTPVGVATFMERHDMRGNVLCNEMNAHAYLAFRRYPHVREFIDGRVPQLFPESALQRYGEILRAPEQLGRLLDGRQTDMVVLQHIFSSSTTALTAMLSRREDFALVHFDEGAMLWTRRPVQDGPNVLPAAYRIVIPPLIDDAWFTAVLAPNMFPLVTAELDRLHGEQPHSRLGIGVVTSLLTHPRATAAQRSKLTALWPQAR